MWTSQGIRQGQHNGGTGSPYASVPVQQGQAQRSPMMAPSPYSNSQNLSMQSSPMLQSMGGWSIMSPYLTHHGEAPVVEGSPPTPEDEATLCEAREFGKTDRLNKQAKRDRLQILNSQAGGQIAGDETLDLNGLEPSEGSTVLEMAAKLRENLGDLVTQARRLDRGRTLSFCLAEDSPQGPKATVGLLLGDKGISRCEVHGCVPGSPAHMSGKLQKGDVIQEVDNEKVTGANIITRIRGDDSPGSMVTLTVERAGKRRTMEVGLLRADVKLVNKKKQVYEMIHNLAQMAGASPLDSDVDDAPTSVGRECVALLKQTFYEHFENELLLQEKVQSRENVLAQAQKILAQFVVAGKESLVRNPSQDSTSSRQPSSPDEPRPPLNINGGERGNRVKLVQAMKQAQGEAAKFQKLVAELEEVNKELDDKAKKRENELAQLESELEALRQGSNADSVPEMTRKLSVQVASIATTFAIPPMDADSANGATVGVKGDGQGASREEELQHKLKAAEGKAAELEKQVASLLESNVGASLESLVHTVKTKVGIAELSVERKRVEVEQLTLQLREAEKRCRVAEAQAARDGGEAETADVDSPSLPHSGAAQNGAMEEEAASLRKQIAVLEAQAEELTGAMASKEEELARLAAEAAHKGDQLRELAGQLADKDANREELSKQLGEKTREVGELGELLSKAGEGQQQGGSQAATELERMRQRLDESEGTVAALKQQLKGREDGQNKWQRQQEEISQVNERFMQYKEETRKGRQLAENTIDDQRHRIESLEARLRQSYDKTVLAEAETASAKKEVQELRRQLLERARASSSPASSSPELASPIGGAGPKPREAERLRVELEESRALIAQLNQQLQRTASAEASPPTPVAASPAATSPLMTPEPPRQPVLGAAATVAPKASRPVASNAGGQGGAESEDMQRLREELRRTQGEVMAERRAYASGIERLKKQRDDLAMEVNAMREGHAMRPLRSSSSTLPLPGSHPPQSPLVSASGPPSAPKLMSPAAPHSASVSRAPSDASDGGASPFVTYVPAPGRFHSVRAAHPQVRM